MSVGSVTHLRSAERVGGLVLAAEIAQESEPGKRVADKLVSARHLKRSAGLDATASASGIVD